MKSLSARHVRAGFRAGQLPAPCVQGSAPAALTGEVSSEAEGAMEGVVVTAHKDGSIVSVSVTTDAQGRYAFPENRLEPGHYKLAIRAVGYDLSAPAAADVVAEQTANVDLKLEQDQESRQPAHQCRMDDEHPRHRRAEGVAAQLHELPHARTHRALDPRRRRVDAGGHPHDGLWRGEPADQAAADAGPFARRHARAIPQDGRISRHHQSERGRQMGLSAQDAAAADRRVDPRHRHRIRPAARKPPSRTTSCVDKDGNVWYSDFGEHVHLASSIRRRSSSPNIRSRSSSPTRPPAFSASSSTRTASSGSTPCTRARIGMLDPKTGEIKYYPLPPEWNDDRVQLNFVGLRHDVDGKVWTKSVGTAGHLPPRSRDRQMGEIPPDRRSCRRASTTASIR